MLNRRLTGREFHVYLNPEREIDEAAFKVHGISRAYLEDKPLFSEIVDEFMAFIENAELIIHNAAFDIGFLKAELGRLARQEELNQQVRVLDTLVLAKQKHPGQRNNLDALCKRYGVNNSNRELHGALLDAELLAFVYLAMTGGQIDLFEDENKQSKESSIKHDAMPNQVIYQTPIYLANDDELALHDAFMTWIEKKKK
jgi:DNA polymerase-3 subunit epsilon